MSILIIGGNGSMGRRYQAILRYLGKNYSTVDLGDPTPQYEKHTGFIIATPTETHTSILRFLIPHKKPILVEKPISKDVKELKEVVRDAELQGTPLTMMYQYSLLDNIKGYGVSEYDFYNHGKDGLIWDCLQIIGLAKGPIHLNEQSPIWRCILNGNLINIKTMDVAYVAFVNRWMKQPRFQDLQEIISIHEKTDSMARGCIYR